MPIQPSPSSQRILNVERDSNVIYIHRLDHENALRGLIKYIIEVLKENVDEIILDFGRYEAETSLFPSVLTPLASFLANLRIDRPDVHIVTSNVPKDIEFTHVLDPVSIQESDKYPRILDVIWSFKSEEDVFKLVNEITDALYQADEYGDTGVLDAIEYCLNEITDNVMNHSEAGVGHVMVQVQTRQKLIAICVSDAGRGIFKSLRASTKYWPKLAIDAITLSLQEGVTRDDRIGQGNGLYILHTVMRQNTGRFSIASAGTILSESDFKVEPRIVPYPMLSRPSKGGGTVVDFQLDYNKPVSMDSILGYHPDSMKIHIATDENTDTYHFKLLDQKTGFGTRRSGERMRNEIVNVLKSSNRGIVLDFAGVGMVSSSFADELVGKLFVSFSPLDFYRLVQLTNLNSTVKTIVNKAIEQRLVQTYRQSSNENTISEHERM